MSIITLRNRLERVKARRQQSDEATMPEVVRFYDPADPPEAVTSEAGQRGPCVFWLPFNGREISTEGGR